MTLIAVAFDLSRERRQERVANLDSATSSAQAETRRKNRLLAPGDDITQMRVDDLAVVPPAELYDVLMRCSPEEIAKIALKFNDLPNNSYFSGAALMFFQAWAELDPVHALEGAFRVKEIAVKRGALNTVLGSASPGAAPQLVAALMENQDKDLTADVKGDFLTGLLERWAWVDPSAAAKYLDDLDDSKVSLVPGADTKIAVAWGSLDPRAALAWIDQPYRPGRAVGGALLAPVLDGWFSRDPGAAKAYITEHMDTIASAEAASSIARLLFEKDPEAAAGFLTGLPSGDARAKVESNFGFEWASKDPVAASHWLEGLPHDDQMASVEGVVGVWSARDWDAAFKWLTDLKGDVRDIAIAAAVTRAPPDVSPYEYLPLALSIKDSQARAEVTVAVIAQWAQSDPDAAVAWVKSSGLSKDEKQEILARPEFSKQQ